MRKNSIKYLKTLLLTCSLIALASLFSSCFVSEENSKTFKVASLLQGGIGGTGIDGGMGGTGIEGTITAFGSIVVNGIHIDYDPQETYSSVFGARDNAELQIGQVVSVTTEIKDGNVTAINIAERTPIAGTVSGVNLDENYITIAGSRIEFARDIQRPSDLSIGSQVAISGFWNQGKVIASLIDTVPTNFNLGGDTIYGFETQNIQNSPDTVALPISGSKLPSNSYLFVRQNSEKTKTFIEKSVPDIASISRNTVREKIEFVGENTLQRKIVFSSPKNKQEIILDGADWKKNELSKSRNYQEKIKNFKNSSPQIIGQKSRNGISNNGVRWENNPGNSGGGGGNSGGGGGNSGGGGGNSGGGGGNSGGGKGNSGGGGGNSGGGKGKR